MPVADPPRSSRRDRRRQETIEEILATAVAVMADRGVGGLTLAEVARRMGIQSPSLYKYFPSLMAIYDELFARGQSANLAAMRDAADGVGSGLDALTAAQEATCRWALSNYALSQLLFWRAVPGFAPSEEAFAPSVQMVELIHGFLRRAVRQHELGPGGASREALDLVGILITGAVSQHLANEPDTRWEDSRYLRLLSRTRDLLVATYPPASA